jgi:hypothetical protein
MQRLKRSKSPSPWLSVRDKLVLNNAVLVTSALDLHGNYNLYSILRERMNQQIEGVDAPYWYVTRGPSPSFLE